MKTLLGIAFALALTACAPAPGTTDGSARASASLDEFARTMLREHDRMRAEVGVEPLRWSPQLSAYAQGWAEYLTTVDCHLMHRPERSYGENLFMSDLGTPATASMRAWEQEKALYRGQVLQELDWYHSGHYSQIVWRRTESVGCAQAECADRRVVVCNYDPPGNLMDHKAY